MTIRITVLCIALLSATTAAAQSQPTLQIGTRQGNYYWVVETAADGSRRGGWVPVSVPLDAIDRNALQTLPPVSALSPAERPQQAPPAPPTLDERLTRIEQALSNGQSATAKPSDQVQSAPVRQASQQPRPQSTAPLQNLQTREGFWFNAGMGWGSASCQGCVDRWGGLSGGLSLGGTINDRFLLGAGTSGWYKSENGYTVTGGTFDTRIRFYPAASSGFFITGGLGLGHLTQRLEGFASATEYGVGAIFGLGWDIRVGRNVSLTPFYNGFAVQPANADGNVAQIGLGVTIH